ncbi:MAG: hypothetical protein QOE59_3080 [Actinomycetota bacterium]|nr:hypothetical protein [Actinomycetota bacterium]
MAPGRVSAPNSDDEDEMANHRTPDGAAHHGGAPGFPVRTTDIPAARATSVWTYGTPAPALPRFADVPADVTAPARPTAPTSPAPTSPAYPSPAYPSPAYPWPAPVVPQQAGPAPLSPARAWPVPEVTAVVGSVSDLDAARRSAADDIAARATTTLIPSSPGARRSRSGPVFVDGSGRRARWFKGVAAAAATLAAGYVGVVVTGALAGPTGPAGTAVPVASGASLAPATSVLGPPPAVVQPAEVTTKKPAPTETTAPKRTTRTAPKKVAPRVIAPVAPPVVPAPVAPVVPPPPAPVVPAVPATPPATTKAGTGTGTGTGTTTPRRNRTGTTGNAATTPSTLST